MTRMDIIASINEMQQTSQTLRRDGKSIAFVPTMGFLHEGHASLLREGRKRQIRRMCELVGLEVLGLKRVRIGSVVLGKLPVGQWRYLRPDERF